MSDKKRNIFVRTRNRYFGNRLNEHRLMLLAYVSIAALIGTLAAALGLMGSGMWANRLLNTLAFLWILAVNIVFAYDHLRLQPAMMMVYLGTGTALWGGMLLNACFIDNYSMHAIMANISLSLVLGIIAVHSFLRLTPFIICVMSIASYALSVYITDDAVLRGYLPYFTILIVLGLLLGNALVRKISVLSREKEYLLKQSTEIKEKLGLTQEQITALMELSGYEEPTEERKLVLYDIIGQKARYRLYHRVSEIIKEQHTQREIMEAAFPELTPSELDICRLILRGKKLNEISEILKKNKSNITCQRSHIRNKFGMRPEDDLLIFLQKRLREKNDLIIEQ